LLRCTGVVNFAGETIGRRWTRGRKRAIYESRVTRTAALVNAMVKHAPTSCVLVSGSAVGYYGNRGDDLLDESCTRGDGFLAEVTDAWEAAAQLGAAASRRTVVLRTGLVIGPGGGVIDKLRLPFALGLGGRLGSGLQWMPWIALADLVRIIERALTDAAWSGTMNAVAAEPVRNSTFTTALGTALRRPTMFPGPAAALRAALGEMADETLLVSQRVVPLRLREAGFRYDSPDLASAIALALQPAAASAGTRRTAA
jgi:uncharacterized protein (TIGR01777 family)